MFGVTVTVPGVANPKGEYVMADKYSTGGEDIMILACSGGSNVGQLSNQVAVELTQEGFGKVFCLSGIGGQLSGLVQTAKDATRMLAIDGCELGCARAILDQAQVPLKNYLVITEEGFEKNKEFDLERSDIDRVKAATKRVISDGGGPVSAATDQ